MEIVTVQKRVILEAKYLTSKIEQYLLDKVKLIIGKECTEKYGYILEIVNDKINILQNTNTTFLIEFQAKILKPASGKKLSGTVCIVIKDGIFVISHGLQKILISKENLGDFTFDPVTKTYSNKNLIIKEGKNIDVIISETKYMNGAFSCFGKLA